jgi:hypothetical protein
LLIYWLVDEFEKLQLETAKLQEERDMLQTENSEVMAAY